jgi:DNA polymerase-3 subunit epsilon
VRNLLRRLDKPERVAWREASWQVVDVETTGLDPDHDEVISYAVVPIKAGRIVSGDHISGLVRPRRRPSPASVTVHGIRASDLENAPTAVEVAPRLAAALSGSLLVVHFAFVERTFLGPVLAAVGMPFPRQVADTEVIGRLWLVSADREAPPVLALSKLADELGLPVHRPHEALGDALTTAQAFLALASHLDAVRPETTTSLLGAHRRLAYLRMARRLARDPA